MFTWVPGATLDEVYKDRGAIRELALRRRTHETLDWREQLRRDSEEDPACLICTL